MKRMIQLKDFNLALGVINNILVCDRRDHILFAGDRIRTLLFPSTAHNPAGNLLDNFPDPAVRTAIKEKLQEVRRTLVPGQLTLEVPDEHIFLFPANINSKDSVIISTREQLFKANQVENDLKERVKELECLYNISHELESRQDLAASLENSAGHLILGFQYPGITTANFKIDGVIYGNPESEETGDGARELSQPIAVNGETRGRISVYYSRPAGFLPEERKLLREIALMVARAIEKEETRRDLELKGQLLLAKNEELTQLTESLSTSNNKLNTLFNAITDTIVVIDRDYTITMSNSFEVGSGGKCYRQLFGSDTLCDSCPAQRAFERGESVAEEKKFGENHYMLQAYPIRSDDGKINKVIEIRRSVTKEKQMELQLIQSYKLASLGKLTAGIAHEINNPNTFLRGNIKIIKESFDDLLPLLDTAYRENPQLRIARLDYSMFKESIPLLMEDMVGGADRIKKIVDGLRNFARKDEGLLNDAVDINRTIRGNLRITEKEVRKHARLQFQLQEDIPLFKGNSQKLEQVLMNIMLNGAQAIRHDHGLLRVETRYRQEDNLVVICISDNGSGIREKDKVQIFDPFFTTKRHAGGTGLGLSISYGIIQEHNGRIEVESQPGEGTAFTIFIPALPPDGAGRGHGGGT